MSFRKIDAKITVSSGERLLITAIAVSGRYFVVVSIIVLVADPCNVLKTRALIMFGDP